MRIEPGLKSDVTGILSQLGLSMADAVTVFLNQVRLNGGLPFEVKIPKPNEVTLRTMQETDNDENMHYFENAEDMFKELGIQ
jgi:DNA-damage-inducible protein J